VFHINIRSFFKNNDELLIFIDQLPTKPDVIILTETWFTASTVTDIDGYNAFHTTRDNRRGGGTSVYIKSKYKSSLLTQYSFIKDTIEICAVNVNVGATPVSIYGIYRPPDKSLQLFMDEMSALMANFVVGDHVFLAGDFNVNMLNPSVAENDCIALFRASSFIPLITIPTHTSRNSFSCIDNIWYNQLGEVKAGAFKVDISDHYPIFAFIHVDNVHDSSTTIKKFRDHGNMSLSRLRESMKILADAFLVILRTDNPDIDELVNSFNDAVYRVYDNCCPIRSKNTSNNRRMKPWITSDVINCINHKHFLFRQFKRGEITFNHYNTFKNHVTGLIRRVKLKYFDNVFRSRMGDVSETWKGINMLLNRKTKKNIPVELISDGVTITEPDVIAECFNNYFSNIAQNLSDRIPYTECSPLAFMGNRVDNSFFVNPTGTEEVSNVISSLKCKSFNLISVPTFIVKYCCDILSPVILELFNLSVRVGKFPSVLKVARVVPVFKSGEKNSLNNYRPISNLSDISKVFEKLMYRRLLEFIKSNHILNSNQFGFQQNASTSDAILEFLSDVYSKLNMKHSVVSVFLDFSKAFDTVKHDVLIRKLDYMGVRGLALDWFQSYLCNRKQYVDIGGHVSVNSVVRMGVPQGSILGPLLFLLYINDMSKCSNDVKFVHFADDTTVFMSGFSVESVVQQMNIELEKVQEWLHANGLSLNVAKTSFMVISDSKPRDIRPVCISDTSIELVNNAKFLGVTVDDRLNFRAHADSVVKSVSRSVGMLNRISNITPPRVKKILYYSLIYSRVSYGIVAWGRGTVCSANRVERLLRRARSIVSYPRQLSIELNLLNFNSMYNYFAAIKIYKVVKLDHHAYFRHIFESLRPIHDHRTRFLLGDNFNTPQLYKTKCQKGFLFQSVNVWNSLSTETRNCSSLATFKIHLKRELLLCQT